MISNLERQFEGTGQDQEKDSQSERLSRLWKKYGFSGEGSSDLQEKSSN